MNQFVFFLKLLLFAELRQIKFVFFCDQITVSEKVANSISQSSMNRNNLEKMDNKLVCP